METTTLQFAELTTADLGNRDITRKNSTSSEEIVKIKMDKIIVRDGFNVRADMGDLQGLAYSILENGQTLPGRVDVLADGNFLLVDGHRRFNALKILIDMGHEPFFKAIVNNKTTTEEQRILQMFTTQDNKHLAPHEQAELMQRLINLGYKQNEVAKKIGKTPAYVSQMLSYANESPVIKEHVKNGNINVSTALKLQKGIPIQSERVEAVNHAVAIKKQASDKPANVSIKDVTGKDALPKPDKSKELAEKISLRYGIEKELLLDLIDVIKPYF